MSPSKPREYVHNYIAKFLAFVSRVVGSIIALTQSEFCCLLYQITLIYHCQKQLETSKRNKFPEKLLQDENSTKHSEELIEFATSLSYSFVII